jgi:hypothetical protein
MIPALEVFETHDGSWTVLFMGSNNSHFWGEKLESAIREYHQKIITEWCDENGLDGRYIEQGARYGVEFSNKQDAILFYLAHA